MAVDKFEAKLKFEEIIDGGYRFYCLSTIIDLGVQDVLNNNGDYMSAEQIATQIPERNLNAINLQRVLRYLACFDVVEEKYGEDAKTILFKTTDVLKQKPCNPLLLGKTLFPRLQEALNIDATNDETSLAVRVYGKSYWELVKGSPQANQLFLNTLQSLTDELKNDIPKVVEIIQCEGKENASVIDIGGSTGDFMEMIKDSLPRMQFSNFDLKSVIDNNKPIDGVKMVAGDMFDKETMPSKDIYITKNIFHDWNDEKCVEILKNIRSRMNEGGIVVSVNYMLPEPGQRKEAWWNRSMDLTLLVAFHSARTRTLSEFQDIHQKAGFKITRSEVIGEIQRPSMVLVAKKAVE